MSYFNKGFSFSEAFSRRTRILKEYSSNGINDDLVRNKEIANLYEAVVANGFDFEGGEFLKWHLKTF